MPFEKKKKILKKLLLETSFCLQNYESSLHALSRNIGVARTALCDLVATSHTRLSA